MDLDDFVNSLPASGYQGYMSRTTTYPLQPLNIPLLTGKVVIVEDESEGIVVRRRLGPDGHLGAVGE